MEENVNTEINNDFFDFDVLVSEKEPITVTIRVTKGVNPVSGKPKMVIYRYNLVQENIKLLDTLLSSVKEKIDKIDNAELTEDNVKDKKELNVLNGRLFALEAEKLRYETLLEQPYKEWYATFKQPDLAERVSVESRSYTEDAFGENKEFNEFENIRAKFELLLIEWNVDSKGKVIPIKSAMKCDNDILRAFSEELDVQMNGYIFEEKKS
jgi:hypothetical protein